MSRKKGQTSIISYYDKESPSATEFRRIYSKIISASGEKKMQTIMLTSATVGEGKSVTSSFLAITAAALNREKVVLVDLDLRRPRIHEYFATSLSPGVADVLTKKTNIKSVSRTTVIPNLSIITAGKAESSPSDILDQADLQGFMQELQFYFDMIIIDSPPLIPVSDPMLFADKVDGVVMVVKSGTTQREVVSRAANLLVNSGIHLLGIILNDIESVLPYYYKDHYYRYHYSQIRTK